MDMPLLTSTRYFQLWGYKVSHQWLLFRSPKAPGQPTNLDIAFWGVQSIQVATRLHGLELDQLADFELESLEPALRPRSDHDVVFRLSSDGQSNYVLAAGCIGHENELDIFDTTLIDCVADRRPEEYGDFLFRSYRPD